VSPSERISQFTLSPVALRIMRYTAPLSSRTPTCAGVRDLSGAGSTHPSADGSASLTFPAVVCAWCTRLISRGSVPLSHGMCEVCRDEFFPKSKGPAAHLSASTTGPSTKGV
jgi:hypothetical protein